MPITKFRTHEAAAEALWETPGTASHLRAIESVWRLSEWASPIRFPPGVYRYRSIEAAKQERDACEARAHMDIMNERATGRT